ncbi:MAG: two-component system phosphate regulon sensor histidine kinase PhoR [Bacteroidia bacterium]|jgi:two-component system phosphate regulon sensor histidine kinase PhoR
MSWSGAAGRILLFLAVAVLLGWNYGHPLLAVCIALLGLVLYWLYQIERVNRWLQSPDAPPPDIYGVLGDVLSQVYLQQRHNKEIQKQLTSSVEYLQSSFASMRDGVVMVASDGTIAWCNRAVEPLLGLRYPQDTGQTLTNLVRFPRFNEYFLAGDYHKPLQYSSTTDGRTHLRVEITHFGDGERLLFVRDVSMPVRLEQIRSDFVANVSHELRTPLTVISGYLSTFSVSAAELPPKYSKPVRQMLQQAERMENLLKDLLWLSRIEGEEREEKRELLDVGGLLMELKEDLTAAHPDTSIELHLGTKQRINGDYRQVYSAISNLATNAIKYSPPGMPVTINWSLQQERCRLSVNDQGIGIEASHIPRLTERFYRVDESRSSATGGTGLGLAIVKHVAAAHDANLDIQSTPGKGSTFTLEFPIED